MKALLIITGFLQEDLGNRREISQKESLFISEKNIASDCNVKFFHSKLQGSRVLDGFLKEHISCPLFVFFTDGISETGEKMYREYLSLRKNVSFLKELPQTLEVCQ